MIGQERGASLAFASARINVLRLLAFQAATSLDNGRLFGEVRERDARARRLFNANIIGIFTWNLDGRILEANEAFLRIVGYGSDDLASGRMRWKDLMPPDWSPDDDLLLDALKSTGIAPPFEAEYIRKDGSHVPVLVGAALFDEMPSEGVAFVLDLTDRMRAEEAAHDSLRRCHAAQMRLADANRIASIGQLSASIAHEINQPLSGITINASTCLRMLAADPPQIEGAREAARRLLRDADRASDVIVRLRALFAGKETAREPVDLNETTLEAMALSAAELEKVDVTLRTDLAEGLPPVTGDRVQLQQVIMNLLRNAIDAMKCVEDRPRELVITTGREDSAGVRLSVQDTGTGFDPARMHELFQAFYTTKRDGMGIGLSVSHSIVESHRGRLWAEVNDGPGATFSFCIPSAAEGAAVTSTSSPSR
ncbi:sensor histidine kinase [Variovorax sp. GT1P44]|uniref:sensor histidine kinase n=1 Tax=Variovorax sp. GT1P44 TaxID=3443742 RepID=UPI003F473D9C